jgi:hypothetical protein
MDDMQLLMDTVRRLQSQGVDVLGLLGGNTRQPPDPQQFNGMDVSDFPVPEMKPFTGPGPGAVVTQDDMDMTRRRIEADKNPLRRFLEPSDFNPSSSDPFLPMPEMKPFTGPGPGAVVSDSDRGGLLGGMRDKQKIRSLLELFGGN